MNARTYTVLFIPTGFQIYGEKSFLVPLILLSIGDACLASPNIHKGIDVIVGYVDGCFSFCSVSFLKLKQVQFSQETEKGFQ